MAMLPPTARAAGLVLLTVQALFKAIGGLAASRPCCVSARVATPDGSWNVSDPPVAATAKAPADVEEPMVSVPTVIGTLRLMVWLPANAAVRLATSPGALGK